jgi:hypothetical protein
MGSPRYHQFLVVGAVLLLLAFGAMASHGRAQEGGPAKQGGACASPLANFNASPIAIPAASPIASPLASPVAELCASPAAGGTPTMVSAGDVPVAFVQSL